MSNIPWRTLLVPLVVAFVSLFSGIFLRGMMISDFQRYIDDQRQVLVRVVSADMERAYEKSGTWNRAEVQEDVLRALTLGLRLKLVNARGETVLTTEDAVAQISPARKAQLPFGSGPGIDDPGAKYRSFPLIRGEVRVGSLEVKFLKDGVSDNARMLSGSFVLAWVLLFSGPTLALGFLIVRTPAAPAAMPDAFVPKDNGAEPDAAVLVPEKSEAAEVQSMTELSQENETPSRDESASKAAIRVKEHEPPKAAEESAESDDEDDGDDEDMQPLAGDPDRITRIVEGLNNLNKARALGRALHKQPIELAPYLAALIEKTRGTVLDKNIDFNLECRSELMLSADPDCLTEILTNLLDNAAKAIKHAGTVSVCVEEQGDRAVFTVRDTGTGIRRKALPHLFEQYYRGSGSGIGLGLTIVKELVDACGGAIDVRTRRGNGSSFIVSLPGV